MPPSNKPLKKLKVLFADDEKSLQDLLSVELRRWGHEVTVCTDGRAALATLEHSAFDLVLVDLDMPGASGIDVIAKAKLLAPDTDAVILTGKSSAESAIAAVKYQAIDYLTKPCKLVDLKALLGRVMEKREMQRKFQAMQRQLERAEGPSQLIGESNGMLQVRQLIARVAPTTATVLILGETGTGKELIARAVHRQSLRAEQPYVAVNCGALPESLIESELFGHRKGAFTGADDHRTGLFEVASGGTIFLDEVGELPKPMQAKLLRVLESGEIRRVGENDARHVDCRVVCATHRNLPEMVEQGDFREDLMFRINTFEITVPPLRQRLEDMPQLADFLVRRFRSGLPATAETLTPAAIEVLQSHTWPGNVRELANVIERATILCDQLPLQPEHLPQRFATPHRLKALGPMTLRDLELQAIHEALDRTNGNKQRAAEELGVSVKTLYNKLNEMNEEKKSA